MGYVDEKCVTLACSDCGTETLKARESGSGWGSTWGSFNASQRFNVTVEDTQFGPRVVAATCKQCGTPAAID